jgi:hypothetical protein
MSRRRRWSRRILLLGALLLAVAIPTVGLILSRDAATAIGLGVNDFLVFIAAVTVLGVTSVTVGVVIVWRKPGNRIGMLLMVGGLMLMTVFTSWPLAILRAGEAGPDDLLVGLTTWWGMVGVLPAIVLLYPAVGITFPDGRLPGPRWRWPVLAGAGSLVIGVILATIAPWRLDDGFRTPNPFAIPGVSSDVSDVGGGLAALGAFMLIAIAVLAVVARYRRSAGVERAQQKWFVLSIVAMAVAFPFSYATDIGPAQLIDFASILTGALVPIAIGIAILRYHLFEIDRIVSRTIAYGLMTAILVIAYTAAILVLQGPLGTVLGGDTIAVALSTLVVAALFQPVRRRVKNVIDRRFDRARIDAERTTAAFSERLRDEVDIATVTADLDETVRSALKPQRLGLWLRGTIR